MWIVVTLIEGVIVGCAVEPVVTLGVTFVGAVVVAAVTGTVAGAAVVTTAVTSVLGTEVSAVVSGAGDGAVCVHPLAAAITITRIRRPMSFLMKGD